MHSSMPASTNGPPPTPVVYSYTSMFAKRLTVAVNFMPSSIPVNNMANARYRAGFAAVQEENPNILLKNGISFHTTLPNGKLDAYQSLPSNGHIPKCKTVTSVPDYKSKESFEASPFITIILAQIGFYVLIFLGFVNQLLFTPKMARETNRQGYAELYNAFEVLYLRYAYRRIRDCWNRPICSSPGAEVTLKDRITHDYCWSFEFTGTETKCINVSSFNYLGFAETTNICALQSIKILEEYGCGTCSTRLELGNLPIHDELEKLIAKYLGVEDAIVFGMGFGTNTLNLPALVSKGCLVLSDEKNHASLIIGLRLSGAVTRVFKHNDVKCLEKRLQEAIVGGQPDSGEPWKKIFIVVEGIYSMEGSIVHLPEVVKLKQKYKAYLYVDEAHSTGALGKHGRGVCDYYGIDPRQIDILMGTFTKSYASAGGYIAGSKELIDYLRVNSHAHTYASAMSPSLVQQVISSMRIIMGEYVTDFGEKRLKQLARNVRYFRRKLHQIGVIVHGNEDSPVVLMLVYHNSKIGAFIRELTTRGIAVAGVGFPATPLLSARIRFCLSAAHTKQQLEYVVENIAEIADTLGLEYSKKPRDLTPIEYYSDSETE